MQRNTAEVELPDGKKVGFKCGTLAIGLACRESGSKTIEELIKKMADGDIVTILALFYGSAVQYGHKEVTMNLVSDWLEDMGEEKANEVTLKLLEWFKPKNTVAPQVGASQPTQ